MILLSHLGSVLSTLRNPSAGYFVAFLGLTRHRPVEAFLSILLLSSVCRRDEECPCGLLNFQLFADACSTPLNHRPPPTFERETSPPGMLSAPPEKARGGQGLSAQSDMRGSQRKESSESHSPPSLGPQLYFFLLHTYISDLILQLPSSFNLKMAV